MLRALLHIDVFRVVQDRERHLTPKTQEGGVASSIAIVILCLLIGNETVKFFSADIRTNMFVDKNQMQRETVHFNISFTQLACHHITVEIFDPMTGQPVPELSSTIRANRDRLKENRVSEVLGPYNPLALTGEENEGCRVSGVFSIDKVPGNFLIAARNDALHAQPISDHIIHEFWIGEQRLDWRHDHIAEKLVNALGGVQHIGEDPPHTLYQYYLQIVPTYLFNERVGQTTKLGYQYTATFSKAQAPAHLPPGVYFRHQHTPLAVEYVYRYITWSHFLVHLCAIVGGVYTVVGFAVPLVSAARQKFIGEQN